jgi:hypothetical protein
MKKIFLFGSRKWFWLSVIAQFAIMAGERLSNATLCTSRKECNK